MALEARVFDNQKLHLLSCLTRAYGYKLRLITGGEFGYEFSIWGNKSIGLGEELLAGGQGYDIDEAIDNCFEDCKDQKKLLASDSCQWIEFHDADDLDITLTLMGHHPSYEPVHMKCIDFNKWEVGPDDGEPIILVAQPDPSKKDTESIYSKAKHKNDGILDMNSPEMQLLAKGMGVSPSQLGNMFSGTQVIGVAPGQSMTLGLGPGGLSMNAGLCTDDDDDDEDEDDEEIDESEVVSSTMKVKFLVDIPACCIKKDDVRDVDIKTPYKHPDTGEVVHWDPDCMDEVSRYVEDAVTIYLRAHGLPTSESMAGEMFYHCDDDVEEEYQNALTDQPDPNDWDGNSAYMASLGSVYDPQNRTVDHSKNTKITDEMFCVLNILDVIDDL